MINEPIIIDGVDVSRCKHFKNATCIADYLLTDMNFSEAKCELCKDCYYKQLKHNEQENKKLKQTLLSIKNIAEENIRIADLEGLNGVYRRGLAEQILQKIKNVSKIITDKI